MKTGVCVRRGGRYDRGEYGVSWGGLGKGRERKSEVRGEKENREGLRRTPFLSSLPLYLT